MGGVHSSGGSDGVAGASAAGASVGGGGRRGVSHYQSGLHIASLDTHVETPQGTVVLRLDEVKFDGDSQDIVLPDLMAIGDAVGHLSSSPSTADGSLVSGCTTEVSTPTESSDSANSGDGIGSFGSLVRGLAIGAGAGAVVGALFGSFGSLLGTTLGSPIDGGFAGAGLGSIIGGIVGIAVAVATSRRCPL